MNTHADKTQENKSQSVANGISQKQSSDKSTFQFVDNRPEAIAQRKLQEMANNSPQAKQATQLQEMASNSSQQKEINLFQNSEVAQLRSHYHYTDKNGHDGITANKTIWPSTEDGLAHTHYGKGHYFSDLDPQLDAMYMGMPEFAETLFNQLSKSNKDKMMYYVEVKTDDLPLEQQVDDKYGFPIHIFLNKSENNLDISNTFLSAGPTYFQQLADLGYDPRKFTGSLREKYKAPEPGPKVDYDKMGYWGVD